MPFNNRTMRDMSGIIRLVVICTLPIILNMTHGQELDPSSEHTHQHFNESVNESGSGQVYTYEPFVTTGPIVNENSEAPMTTKETTHHDGPKCISESYQPEEPQCNNRTFTGNYHAYTCDGRCDDPNINATYGPYCSCHELCLISKDCCVDFKTFCWEAYKTGEQMRETIEASESFVGPECTQLFAAPRTKPYWTVTKCPKGYPYSEIRFKCEGPITKFTQIVPVASKATGLSYKNYYCAQCNNVTDIISWGLKVTCTGIWEGSIDSPQTLVTYTTRGDCQLNYMSHIGHKCLLTSQQVAILPPSCHGNWLGCSKKHVHLCENGFQMPVSMQFMDLTGFKNIHCFICKFGNLPRLRDIHCRIFFPPGQGGEHTLGKFSFGILVDFDPAGGSNVGFDFKGSLKVFGCKMNTSDSSECISYCLDGYDYIKGQCVFRYQLFPMEMSGKWYSPGLKQYLDSHRRPSPYSKDSKADIVSFLSDILNNAFIVENIFIHFNTFNVREWDDANQMVNFNCKGKYKLKASDILSKAEIHANLFSAFVNHVKHYPRNSDLNLKLLTMCFKMFQRHSCWDYGRIKHYGNDLKDNYSNNTLNSTDKSNSTDLTPSGIMNKTVCPMKTLDPQSFELLTNGSIFIIHSETLISPDDFMLVENTVYVCVNESAYEEKQVGVWKFDNTMGLLTIICSTLSSACLAIRLALQPIVPLYQNFPGRLQFSLVLALFIAGVFFLIGPNCTHIKTLCVTFGVLIHWSYLAAFTWTVIIAGDMYMLFGPSSFSRSSDRGVDVFITYSILGWGVPVILVAIALGLDFSDIDPLYKPMYGAGELCWITQRYALIIFFTLPIALTIIINIGFFIPTAFSLWKSMSKRAKTTNSKQEYPVGIYAKLFCLMGLTWIFAFIAPYNTAFWYIFIVLNSSQGIYIFVAFVLTKKVWISLSSKRNPLNSTSNTNSTMASASNIQTLNKRQETTEMETKSQSDIVRVENVSMHL